MEPEALQSEVTSAVAKDAPPGSSGDEQIMLLRLAEKAIHEAREEEALKIFESRKIDAALSSEIALRWARVGEVLGRLLEAEKIYKEALSQSSQKAEILKALGRMHSERGDVEKARGFFLESREAGLPEEEANRLHTELQLIDAPEEDFDPLPVRTERDGRIISKFLDLFRGKEGVYARQWYDRQKDLSGYAPIPEPLTSQVVEKHLAGTLTVGLYVLRDDATVCFAALDLDMGKRALERAENDHALREELAVHLKRLVRKVHEVSSSMDLKVVFEMSGQKGVHAWYFFEEPVPATFAVAMLNEVVGNLTVPQGIHVEIFPKQVEHRGKGYGNLIKLPLGVHRKTGRRSIFLDSNGDPIDNSLEYLLQIKKNPPGVINTLTDKYEQKEYARKVVELSGKNEHALYPRQDTRADAISLLLDRCHMVGYLAKKAAQFHHLSFTERKVLLGVLGHLENGKEMLHTIISQCSDYSPVITDHYISKLKGTPLGCQKIRRLLFYLEGSVPCKCSFPGRGSYPSPVLHINNEIDNRGGLKASGGDIFNELEAIKESIKKLCERVGRLG